MDADEEGEKLFTISEENAFWLTCTELDEPTSYGDAAGRLALAA